MNIARKVGYDLSLPGGTGSDTSQNRSMECEPKNNRRKALPKWKFLRRPFNTRQDEFFAVVVDFEKIGGFRERSSFV